MSVSDKRLIRKKFIELGDNNWIVGCYFNTFFYTRLIFYVELRSKQLIFFTLQIFQSEYLSPNLQNLTVEIFLSSFTKMTPIQSIHQNSRSTRNGKTRKTSGSVVSPSLTTEEEIMKRSAPAIIEPDTEDVTELSSNSKNVKTLGKKQNTKKKGKKTRQTVERDSSDDVESHGKHVEKNDMRALNRMKKDAEPQTPSTSLSLEKSKIVTPSTTSSDPNDDKENVIQLRKKGANSSARRSLMPPLREISQVSSSSLEDDDEKNSSEKNIVDKVKTKRNAFGHTTSEETVLTCTRKMYSLVSKMTGKLGGNGHGGAIYGELTIGSMQKMIDLMKQYTNLNSTTC